MNDLGWIKYRPDLMFLDTVGMSASGERAHRRLMDYIWLNDGPPSKDNEILKAISQTIPQDWGRTKQELQGKGWVEVGEFFLHRRAIDSLNESKEAFLANHNRTCRANKLPPKRMSSPHPTTGVVSIVDAPPEPDVTPSVTDNVTQDVTPPMTPTRVRVRVQEDQRDIKKARGGGIPTSVEEVIGWGKMDGVSEDQCRAFFAHYDAQGWLVGNGLVMTNARAKLAGWSAGNRATTAADRPTGKANGAVSASTQAILDAKELERVEAGIGKVLNSCEAHQELTPQDRSKLAPLRARRAELKERLGFKA